MCFALQLIPGVAIGLLMLFRPESPRYLDQSQREEEALRVLARLHANGDENDLLVRS
jgi:hypothetical protein